MISSIDLKIPQQLIMPTAKHSILVKGFCTKISSHDHILTVNAYGVAFAHGWVGFELAV